MKRVTLLQVCVFCLVALVSAQNEYTFKGVIKGDDSPLPGAQFVDLVTDKIVAITDNNGEFMFKHSAPNIRVQFLGYEDKTLSASVDFNTVVLASKNDLLSTFVVTEGKRARLLQNSTISLEVIKPELISNTAPLNADETLGRISGIQVVDNQPSIRSGSGWSYGAGSRVQLLVNGVPLLSGDAGQPLWTFVPTEAIESIEVIKGSSSVLYGSSALNGVINVKTRKPKDKAFTQLSLTGGPYSKAARSTLDFPRNETNFASNLSVFHASKVKNLGITAGLNLLNDEGYKMSDHDKRARINVGLDRVYGEKDLRIGLNTTAQLGNSSSFLLWESYDLGYSSLDSGITKTQANRVSVDPYLVWKTGKVSHNVNTRYLYVDNKVDNGDTSSDQSNQSQLLYAEYRASTYINRLGVNASLGTSFISAKTASPLFTGNQTAKNSALYLQLEKKISKLTFNGGVRYESFSLNDSNESKPVFRAGLNYKLLKYTFLRASYGQGYRFPSIAESYITTTVGPVSIYPNNNLQSETGSNLEFGLKQGFKIGKTGLLLDGAWYRMEFNNLMEFTFGQWGPVRPPLFGAGFKTLNTGKSEISGFETTLSFERKGKLNLTGFVGFNHSNPIMLEPNKVIAVDNSNTELTFRNTSANSNGNVLKYRPRNQFKADVIVDYNKVKIGFGAQYQSKMENIDTAFIAPPISFYVPGIETSFTNDLTQYLLLNARVGYEPVKGINLNLIATNLLNKEYAIRPADLGAPRLVRLQIIYTKS